ncbi:hypothetical protein GCM10025734_12660 [Kitasatospora paranensis]
MARAPVRRATRAVSSPPTTAPTKAGISAMPAVSGDMPRTSWRYCDMKKITPDSPISEVRVPTTAAVKRRSAKSRTSSSGVSNRS